MLKRQQLIGANFSFQHHPFRWVAEQLRLMGFTRMELWGIAPHLDLFNDGPARLAEVRTILDDNGISLHCLTAEQVVYPINIASGDKDYRNASVERFLRAADICAELDARYLFLTPGRGFENESRETARANSLESLNRIASHARSLGVACLLEPLQRVESNIVNTVGELNALLRDIDGDDVDVVLDLCAMAAADDSIADYFAAFGKRLAHIHIVDGTPAGHLGWGEGKLPLDTHLADIAALGFEGTFTFEPFGNGSYALDPLAVWRRCLAGIEPHLISSEAV